MNYVISGIGGCLFGASLAAGNGVGMICGTIWICSGLIITAIEVYRT